MYVMNDFICIGLHELQGPETENYKMKNSCPERDSKIRPLNLKATTVTIMLSQM